MENVDEKLKQCCRCKQLKTLNSFTTDKRSKDGRASACHICLNEWRNKNKERINKERMEWYHKNPEKASEYNRKKYLKFKEKMDKKSMEYFYKNHEKLLLQNRKRCKETRKKYKLFAFEHYSKGKNCCEGINGKQCEYNCGIPNKSDIDVLSIDHINGNGRKHLKENKIVSITNWLVKNNFPEGFRVLCMNCQFKERIRKNQFRTPRKLYFDNKENTTQ